MTFQDWYKTMPKLTESELRIARISWDKCKEEVIKILKDEKNQIGYESYGGFGYKHINPLVLGEIEKL